MVAIHRASTGNAERTVLPYLSRLHASWLADRGHRRWQEISGTLVFADVSGFTPLAERLAKRGKVGAEELTDTLNAVFGELLRIAGTLGGDCLKFGGDALLLLFTGDAHADRGAAAAHEMLAGLRRLRRSGAGAGLSKLNMSVGVHTGQIHAVLAGSSHRELVVSGHGVSEVLRCESLASGGEILLSDAASAALTGGAQAPHGNDGHLLLRPPDVLPHASDGPFGVGLPADAVSIGVPELLRAHLDGRANEGEHRVAAVGFLKFGGTDAVLADHGPDGLAEALDALVTSAQRGCAEHDVTFLGTDVDVDGGKIILATGMPTSSPDDEDRLLLALRSTLDETSGGALSVRAGVHRGRIFAVDLGGADRRAFTVMGDVVNLAARVMGHADWLQLVATQAALDRTRTAFEATALEPFSVKGKSQKIHAQVVGAARGRRSELSDNVRLIGRVTELTVLRGVLESARSGRGGVVELVGDPGIGKSKLLSTVTSLDHGFTRFSFEAGRYSLATPYFALRRGMRAAMGIPPDATTAEVEPVLHQLIESTAPELAPWLPLLGVPLGVDLPDTPESTQLDPANRQSTLHAAVVTLMSRLLVAPALITVEDSHWLDQPSCDLLRALLEGVEQRPWAVIVTRRNVVGGLDLDGAPGVERCVLEALARSDLVELAQEAAGGTILAPGVLDDLVDRSGGNPMFLQELVRATTSGSLTELPDTIEAVVAATIDTLNGRDRLLLRHAAVLGGHFPSGVLAAMLDESPALVQRDVERLNHFLTAESHGMVKFRHILLRDVAYEGLPFRTRRHLHDRAGTILEASTPTPEVMAELLSVHFHRSGRFDQAWRYSRIAGERAQHNGAPVEAAAFFTHALEAGRRLNSVAERDRAEVAERLGDTWELAGRYGEASAAYQQARRLVPHDAARQVRLCRKIGYVRDHEGRYTVAQRWFTRGLSELETITDDAAAAQARAELTTAAVSSKIRQGRHVRAIPQIEQAIADAKRSGDRRALAHAYFVYDQLLVDRGRYTEANHARLAAEIYEELGDHRGAASGYNETGNTAYWLGRWDDAVASYERAIEADQRAGALVNNAIYLNNIGEIRSDQGRLGEAQRLFSEALDLWTSGGWRIGSGWALSNLGRAAARAGDLALARDRLVRSCEVLSEIGGEAMLVETEAREMERLVLAGEGNAALAMVEDLLARSGRLGLVSVTDMVKRLAGYAQCQLGDPEAGIALIEESLAGSVERGAEYEAALAREALVRVASRSGREASEHAAVVADVFRRLGVVATPEVPLP